MFVPLALDDGDRGTSSARGKRAHHALRDLELATRTARALKREGRCDEAQELYVWRSLLRQM